MKNRPVCVVVLGDIGRSPRMQYHALSFAKEGYDVDIVGYKGAEPIHQLLEHPKVNIKHIPECPNFHLYLPRLVSYILKVLWQTITLLFALGLKRVSGHVLVQNPPSVPALAVCWLYCRLVYANFVTDWHNYGYTILALTLGHSHSLVRMSHWFEGYFGRKADGSLCVTKAMKVDLKNKWNIVATTLYDRPPEMFHPVSVLESHELFKRLALDYPTFAGRFTEELENGEVVRKSSRPGLVVSSTSWTEDEDFTLLLAALQDYEEACDRSSSLPELVCVVTGKGPLKEHYCRLLAEKHWKHVQVVTPWLEASDYPLLLASADLGVCLHTSSSGLDLPMKVLDMFGCGLPVCAYSFKCLNELVQHDVNGLIFEDATQLSEQIQSWFNKFPEQPERNIRLRKELESFQKLRWHENWVVNALPLFHKK